MIVYISDLKNSTKKLLQLITILNKVAKFKIKSEDTVALLYRIDKQTRKEIREIRSSTIDSNNIKQKACMIKNFKMLKKQIKEDMQRFSILMDQWV